MSEINDKIHICSTVGRAFDNCNEKRAESTPPLVLAYIGDTIYDLYIRSYLINKTTCTAHGLHNKAKKLVCAGAQARAFFAIKDMLTDEEIAVFKKGRNAHSGTVPRSATVSEYRTATGMEALMGYLYLSGQDDRMSEIMMAVIESEEADKNGEKS